MKREPIWGWVAWLLDVIHDFDERPIMEWFGD